MQNKPAIFGGDGDVQEDHSCHKEASEINAVLSNAPMPLRATFFPLGFPVEVVTNNEAVLKAAWQSWHMFSQQSVREPLRVELGVNDDGVVDLPEAPVCRVRGHLLVNIADTGNFTVTDLLNGFAFGWVSRATAESTLYLRYHYLEAAVLSMLSTLRAGVLHAACVVPFGKGMLLCGDSGAGKSSLAFAGARSGWTYVSDDASYLPFDRADGTVIGNCHQIRFRDSGTQLFPELEGRSITPRAAGKPSIEVSTAEFPECRTASSTRIQYIIFLNRNNTTAPGLYPLARDVASSYFHQSLVLAPMTNPHVEKSLQSLLSATMYELRYTDLDWAVERLEDLARTGR